MSHQSEIEFLKQCVTDLERRHALWNQGAVTSTGAANAELRQVDESLHRRTAAMRRAVERTGVSPIERIRERGGWEDVDVVDRWDDHGFSFFAARVLRRAIGAYETGTLPEAAPAPKPIEPLERVHRVLDRLPRVARALRDRYSGRATLKMDDEYDVQDLLRALLTVDFDDVRKEEWTPSYAGKCARMDLLLKIEQVVIEVKITQPGRTEKQIGDELIIDIARYARHPDCKRLVCFVYDPTFQIGNPDGLECDLSRDEPIKVTVMVAPRP